jgi:hypothetical protein
MIDQWLSQNKATIVEHEGKSDIWKLFGAVERQDEIIANFVACKACKKVYTFKPSDGTQTLRKHSCDEGNSGPSAKCMPKKESKNFDWGAAGFSKRIKDIPETAKADLNRTTVIAAAMDFRPLGFATGDGFQLLAQNLVDLGARFGSFKVATLFNNPTTYSRKILPSLAAEARNEIKQALTDHFKSMPPEFSPATFLADHWTDKYRQVEFTSIAVSFVDKDFCLQSYDLCVREYEATSKHASNIRSDLMTKLATYVDISVLNKITGKFVFVSDSDPKLVAALREDFDRQSCAVHDLSLAVKAALKNAELNSLGRMIEDCKVLVRHFKKTGMNNKLSRTLKQDIPTRFNSIHTMLTSIEAVFDEVRNWRCFQTKVAFFVNFMAGTSMPSFLSRAIIT